MVAPLLSVALSLASEFAPKLITGLVGKEAGAIAEKVVNVASELTGKPGEDALLELRENPELQNQFRTRVVELEAELTKAYLADTASARDLTSTLAVVGHGAAWSAPIISVVLMLGFFGMLGLIIMEGVAETASDAAYIMLGALAVSFSQVPNFWLGSSRGSKEKDGVIAGLRGS